MKINTTDPIEFEDELVKLSLTLDMANVPSDKRVAIVLEKDQVDMLLNRYFLEEPTTPGFWMSLHNWKCHVPEEYFNENN